MCAAEEQTVASHQPKYPTTTPPSGPGLQWVMTTQKYFTPGAGPAFCGSVNSSPWQQCHVIQTLIPSQPPAFLTLLVVSANREVGHY